MTDDSVPAGDRHRDRYEGFPDGFFTRRDEGDDSRFYGEPRALYHIDDGAIAAVRDLYDELGLYGEVLDLCSSWVSHLARTPQRLVALGMNADELEGNEQAHEWVVHDLNREPALPFADASFDGAMCTVSVDYLIRPLEVFDEVARVLRPGAPFVCTFSNRCFPTKVIRGWLGTDDEFHVRLVAEYFHRSNGWDQPRAEQRPTPTPGDPLFAVWAHRRPREQPEA
ncbi:MAG: methyltransferase domain-containing protein [Actinobacteria bacterium]|nr:methyltransferase domain-containing protein [Actinomycetota bacterium]